MPAFTEWESFYVIVGSSGAALTGLQFVVVALMVDVKRRSTTRTMDAFATPTIVHFCATLLLAGVLSAPWQTARGPSLALGAIGFAGVAYAVIVFMRARSQTEYRPVFEDWLFHTALPFVAYGVVALAAIALRDHTRPALFWIAGATIGLLFIGIHNAWDTVTFLAIGATASEPPIGQADPPKS
jgi:hypothetical protein